MPRSSMPWLASTCASYFRWWPTLSTSGSSSSGFSARALRRGRAGPARPGSRAPAARRRPRPARWQTTRRRCRPHVIEAGRLGVEGERSAAPSAPASRRRRPGRARSRSGRGPLRPSRPPARRPSTVSCASSGLQFQPAVELAQASSIAAAPAQVVRALVQLDVRSMVASSRDRSAVPGARAGSRRPCP